MTATTTKTSPDPRIPLREPQETTMIKATGIFSWPGEERRSDRYGMIGLWPHNCDETATVTITLPTRDLIRLSGSTVTITARVLETRDSGHIGDLFRGICPSTPEHARRWRNHRPRHRAVPVGESRENPDLRAGTSGRPANGLVRSRETVPPARSNRRVGIHGGVTGAPRGSSVGRAGIRPSDGPARRSPALGRGRGGARRRIQAGPRCPPRPALSAERRRTPPRRRQDVMEPDRLCGDLNPGRRQ